MKESPEACIARLYNVLHRIARGYMTPDQLRRRCEKEYGIPYAEALEMSYENIQAEAGAAIQGLRQSRQKVTT
jgi:hypothetical protein